MRANKHQLRYLRRLCAELGAPAPTRKYQGTNGRAEILAELRRLTAVRHLLTSPGLDNLRWEVSRENSDRTATGQPIE